MSRWRFGSALASAVLLVFTLLSAGAVQTFAQDHGPDQLRTLSREELDVVKVLTAQERAWNKGDIDAFLSAYKNGPDVIFVGGQISHGYEQLVNDYKKNFPNRDAMGTLTFSEPEPHILDERYAVVVGKYHLDRGKKAGGPADGVFSLVLEKTKDGWKIIVDHTT